MKVTIEVRCGEPDVQQSERIFAICSEQRGESLGHNFWRFNQPESLQAIASLKRDGFDVALQSIE